MVTFLPVPSLLTGTVTVRLSLADGLGLALPLRLFGRLCRVLKHILGGGRAVSGGGDSLPAHGACGRGRGARRVTCLSSLCIFWMRWAYCPSFRTNSLCTPFSEIFPSSSKTIWSQNCKN